MNAKFDTAFARNDTERRARHGMPWTESEYESLRNLFLAGTNLEGICKIMQRPADGVLAKLRTRGFISYSAADYCDYYRVTPTGKAATTEQKETTMNRDNLIESKIFINGADATGMSDMEIFRLIAKTEGEIAKLSEIKVQSKKLTATIDKLKAEVAALAEYVDNRE